MSTKLPRIGGRVWKTGVAVAASLGICRALHIPEPVFAGVAAVICVQPTVLQSFKKGAQRLQATVLGALVGLAAVALVTHCPSLIVRSGAAGVAVVIAVWFCLALRWQDALSLSATTVVVIMVHGDEGGNLLVYALERTLVTAIGVITASLVNVLMIWPTVEDRFPKRLPQVALQAFAEFEEAVEIFCRRDLAQAQAANARWRAGSSSFATASSELSWFQESNTVKQMLPLPRAAAVPVLAEIFYMLDTVHNSARSILQDTCRVLEEHPKYVLEDAQVYHIILDALKPASELRWAIAAALGECDSTRLSDAERDWTSELHARFVASMRAAHRSPRDIFPLFEVAKVGIELRNYTRMLARIRQLLLENPDALAILRRYH